MSDTSDRWDTGTGTLPAYPNGWYALAFSDEIGAGEVQSVRAFGRELVVYRGQGGAPTIVDAFCPHMGAHLGHGGRVCDDDLVCPFHGWRWSREGACLDVPRQTTRPPGKPLRTWPCRDRNGFLYIWHHTGDEEPTWEVEEVPESVDPRYRIAARKLWPPFASHPQELSENGVDLAHFDTIHKFETRGIDWRPEGHTYTLAYDIEPLDTGLEGDSSYQLASFTEGPSCTRTRFSGSLNGITLHSCLPIDPGVVSVRSLYRFRDDVSDDAAQRVFENSQAGWAADIEIWSHKVYREKPLLSRAEELVPEFRRWFGQFY